MAKTALEQWDETAASNTDVGSINIDEGCASSGMNNAMREHMAQVAKWLGDDTLASATTTDLGSVPGRYVSITGTTTITGLGTIKAGTIKYLKFAGILTLTHNATSLILPGAANIVTGAGDTATFASEGSGNWRCLNYQRTAIAGSYTPAGTAGTNVDSVTPTVCYWSRLGDIVTVWGGVSVDFTAGVGTQSDFRLSLPVASSFGATTDAAGSGASASANAAPLFLNANVANDTLFIRTYAPNTTPNSYSFIASYRVI